MKQNYSLLSDELALIEIRKHQWIESQKAGREIGFATAALDWIRKYGNEWKKTRLSRDKTPGIFCEKRRYRRFQYNLPLLLTASHKKVVSQTNDINLVGLSCTVPVYMPEQSDIKVTIDIPRQDVTTRKTVHQFNARIIKVSPLKQKMPIPLYRTVLSFDEPMRDYLRLNADILAQS